MKSVTAWQRRHSLDEIKYNVRPGSNVAPNIMQLSSTLERPWSGVKLDVELNMSL